MTNGILIFAQQTNFDYIKLAEISALRAKKYLKMPISLVTNTNYKNLDNIFDKVFIVKTKYVQYRNIYDGDKSNSIKWLNFDRYMCYNLSPYDNTLVIDADYIISSNHLSYCFNSDKDFLIFNNDYYFIESPIKNEFKYINEFGVNFYWATVFFFRKTEKNRLFFTLIEHIRNNWEYYKALYSINDTKFRNDFAFSMAINLIHTKLSSKEFSFIPGKLYYTIDKDALIYSNDSSLSFLLHDNSCVRTNRLDIHIMNKNSILRCLDD